MLNYSTENNNSTFGKTLLRKSTNINNSVILNYTFGGDKRKSQNQVSLTDDCSKTSNLLKKLKNLTILKFKVIQAVKLMPLCLKKSVNKTIRDKNKENNDEEFKHYQTNANLDEIDFDNFKIPTKKKKNKKDKITSKLNEIYAFDVPLNPEKTKSNKTKLNEEKLKQDAFKDEVNYSIKEFYKGYCEEMEKQYESIYQRNENLKRKIDSYKRLEEEYIDLQKEMFNYNIFKKINRKKAKTIDSLEINDKNTNKSSYFTNFNCENPKCLSLSLNYVELKREFDTLTIKNNNLKRYFFELKFKKNEIKFHEAQLEEFY